MERQNIYCNKSCIYNYFKFTLTHPKCRFLSQMFFFMSHFLLPVIYTLFNFQPLIKLYLKLNMLYCSTFKREII